MLRTRLIPVLLLQNGLLVRSERFSVHQAIGNPVFEVQRFNEWSVDELIYLDISASDTYDQRRNDHRYGTLSSPMEILEAVGKNCFMPLTWGGRIRSLEQMRDCFRRGADKISINTAAHDTPDLIERGAKVYGSQAIVVCIDVRRSSDGSLEVVTEGGTRATGRKPLEFAQEVASRGAGEILLQSVDRDGMGMGYDLDLISAVSAGVRIPVIALGGAGEFHHYADAVKAGASAVAAANIWHFKELADRKGKRAMQSAGIPVRLPVR